MADNFILSPANNFSFTITVPSGAFPYVNNWFNATKKQGESTSNFILRKIINESLDYRLRIINSQLNDELNSNIDVVQSGHLDSHTTLQSNYISEKNKLLP